MQESIQEQEIEEWRVIEEFPDYAVSNLGRVKSFKKHDGLIGRMLSPGNNGSGYLYVHLCYHNKSHRKYVHILVLESFVGKIDGLQTNHKNGIKLDNRLENLEWVTPSENIRHAYKKGLAKVITGRHPSLETRKKLSESIKGERHHFFGKHLSSEMKEKISKGNRGNKSPNRKLSENKIIEIKTLLKENKLSQQQICKIFGVSDSTVSGIKTGYRWGYIKV